MSLHKKIVFYTLLFAGSVAFPQAPGYMGKRVVAGYGFNFNPMLEGSSAQNTTFHKQAGSAKDGKFSLNITHTAYLEYAVKPRVSLGMELRYFHTGYDNRQVIANNNGTEANWFSSGVPTFTLRSYDSPKDFYIIDNFGGVIFMKAFYNKTVAPWGRYFTFGIVYNITTSSHHEFMYMESKTPDGARDTLLFDFGPPKQSQTSVDLLLGLGRTRIFADRLCLDYGFNTQVLSLVRSFYKFSEDELSRENYIERTTQARINALNRVNLFIKLGYVF